MSFPKHIQLITMLLLILLTCISQFAIINNIWQFSFDDGTYSHAYLIPFITCYLYWKLQQDGKLLFENKLKPVTVIFSLLIMLLLIVFTIAQFTTGYRIFLILFLTSIIAIVYQPSIKVLFPSIFLIFIVPVWGILTTPLQELSTTAVTFLMQFTGIPIYVEENTITIPAGIFEIAGGCSGLRYLIVSLAISSLFIFLNIKKFKPAAIFLFIAIAGALITNWIRITALILIGHFTNMESSLMADHNTFGWYLYIPFMIILFTLGQKYFADTCSSESIKSDNKLINKSNLFVAITLVLISSPLLINNTLYQSATLNHEGCREKSVLENQPLPHIVSKHETCVKAAQDIVTYRYLFDGTKLGQSVDYYANNFEPLNYLVTDSTQNESWNIIFVKKDENHYKINYQFVSGNTVTNNINHLKKIKILNGFKGLGDTQLVWQIQKIK